MADRQSTMGRPGRTSSSATEGRDSGEEPGLHLSESLALADGHVRNPNGSLHELFAEDGWTIVGGLRVQSTRGSTPDKG